MKTKIYYVKSLLILLFSISNLLSTAQLISKDKYLEKTVIIKIKNANKSICINDGIIEQSLNKIFNDIEVSAIKKKFPHSKIPEKKFNEYGMPLIDLSLIYEIKYNGDYAVEKVIRYLSCSPVIEYAEPHYLHKPLYVPDDANNASTYHLSNIHAYEAWDISKGSSDIVIGITDTGTELDNDDLSGNIAYNNNDPFPFNGLDDDNDGFIDNYRGWDLGSNDNTPQIDEYNPLLASNIPHGVWVSGFSSATPDNGICIAGTGYFCKYLPVKISTKDPYSNYTLLTMAYEGIVYAADHGCSIINCSWGGNSYSMYEQDIINYATFNCNALVVAAAGNDPNTNLFYPASYNNVLSVTGTDANDIKCNTNYNYFVDITAPGCSAGNFYSTYQENSCAQMFFGSSFASPIVAGCAGIVKSVFPSYSPLQIAEQLIVTADIIDTIQENLPYAGMLGGGRVNLYKAITEDWHPSVKFINYYFDDNNDSILQSGDIIELKGTYINYLFEAESLNVNLTSQQTSYVQIMNWDNHPGTLATLQTYSNQADPLTFKIKPATPFNQTIILKLNFTGYYYQSVQYVQFEVNVPIIDVDTNKISTSVTTDGTFGYIGINLDKGLGFKYKGCTSLLYEGGLMFGNSIWTIANCFRNNNDFHPVSMPVHNQSSQISDFDVTGLFTEYLLNLKVIQNTYAWDAPPDEDYVIFEYLFINPSGDTIRNFYAALCSDWDVLNPFENKINYDAPNKMSYIYNSVNGIHVGVKLLTAGNVRHFAIDNIPGGGGGNGID
ncbi:MAG: S8 family serine peptidase, partial [Bacteroidia bacterium]|nr:S8 family serine peptidase [Bacteroidia bacterium]